MGSPYLSGGLPIVQHGNMTVVMYAAFQYDCGHLRSRWHLLA